MTETSRSAQNEVVVVTSVMSELNVLPCRSMLELALMHPHHWQSLHALPIARLRIAVLQGWRIEPSVEDFERNGFWGAVDVALNAGTSDPHLLWVLSPFLCERLREHHLLARFFACLGHGATPSAAPPEPQPGSAQAEAPSQGTGAPSSVDVALYRLLTHYQVPFRVEQGGAGLPAPRPYVRTATHVIAWQRDEPLGALRPPPDTPLIVLDDSLVAWPGGMFAFVQHAKVVLSEAGIVPEHALGTIDDVLDFED